MIISNNKTNTLPNEQKGKQLLLSCFYSLLFAAIFFVLLFLRSKHIFVFTLLTSALFLVAVYFGYRAVSIVKECTISPLYAMGYILSRFTDTPPYLNKKALFSKHEMFESHENFIKLEQESRHIISQLHYLPKVRDTFGNSAIGAPEARGDSWRLFLVSVGDNILPEAKRSCPFLVSIVQQCPEIKTCFYSVLPPKVHIPEHQGYFKGLIRYQIALVVPQNNPPYLTLNGEKYFWKTGDGVLFDDTFFHDVTNNSDEIRVVIYMDIKRKFQNRFLNALNTFILDKFMPRSELVKTELEKTRHLLDEQFAFDD